MIFCIICAIVLLQLGISSVSGRTLNVLDFGAVPGSITANLTNRVALVAALNKAVSGDKGSELLHTESPAGFKMCLRTSISF